MAKIQHARRCYNCGVILQTEDDSAIGYVDKATYDVDPKRPLFCVECYKEFHYNKKPSITSIDPDLVTMLDDAKATDALIVYVVDLFSFESSFPPDLVKIISGLNVLVVANKRDLLPHDYDNNELKEYVAHRLRVERFKVLDVIVTSATRDFNIEEFADKCHELRNNRDIYVVGSASSGKSSLIDAFLKIYKNKTKFFISTTLYPNTKARVIEIPLDSSSSMYETPGIVIANSIRSKIDKAVVSATRPVSMVSPKTITLSVGNSIFFGGLAKVDLIGGEATKFDVYTANSITTKKVASKDSDEAFIKQIKKKIVKPTSSNLQSLKDFDILEIEVDEIGERDIGILGLGWIHFTANKQKLRVTLPKGTSLYNTRAKIKENV